MTDIVDLMNALAGRWLDWFGPVMMQAGILAFAVWLADRALRRWVWPQALYALWLLVFVKLVLPPTLASPIGLMGLFAEAYPEPLPAVVFPISDPGFAPSLANGAGTSIATPAVSVTSPESVALSLAAILLLAWIAGALVLVAWTVRRIRALDRVARRFGQEPSPALAGALADAARRIGLRKPPRMLVSPAVESAAVFGIVRPVILVPPDLAPADARYVFLHECAHVRRGDLAVHGLTLALLFVFWPNPLVWIALRRAAALREFSCDATVARALREDTPSYRRTLLAAARQFLPRERPALGFLGLLGLVERHGIVAARIRRLEGSPWRSARRRTVAVAGLAVLVAASVLPMARASVQLAGIVAASRTDEYYRMVVDHWVWYLGPAVVPADTAVWNREFAAHVARGIAPDSVVAMHRRTIAALPGSDDPVTAADYRRFNALTLQSPSRYKVHLLTRAERMKLQSFISRSIRADADSLLATGEPRLRLSAIGTMEAAPFALVTDDLVRGFPDKPNVPTFVSPFVNFWPRQDRERLLAWLVERGYLRREHILVPIGAYSDERRRQGKDVQFGDVDELPRLVADARPAYTGELRAAGLAGDVTAAMTIGADGHLAKFEARRDTDPRLVRAAEDAAWRMRFAPAMLDGQPVTCGIFRTIAVRPN